MLIGLLALQGDYVSHSRVLDEFSVETRLVRSPDDLENLSGLVIPGGESTVMSRLCERYALLEPLRLRARDDFPFFGTCAGLIFLAQSIAGSSRNFAQQTLGALDIEVQRNAYGAQISSFEAAVSLEMPTQIPETIHGVFIRAPRIVRVGEGVETLAFHEENGEKTPVVVRQGRTLAASFHPELAGETRLHQIWLDSIS